MKHAILFICCLFILFPAGTGFCASADQRFLSLLKVLQSKNVIEQADYDRIVNSADGTEASLISLVQALVGKGILTQEQSEGILAGPAQNLPADSSIVAVKTTSALASEEPLPRGRGSDGAAVQKASASASGSSLKASSQSSEAAVAERITAIAPRPVELLPLTPIPPAGPLAFHLGSGAIVGLSGMIKTNLIQASNESSGDDFPIFARVVGTGPETANSTGTTNKPGSLRLKTRSIRTGLSFSAPDISHKFDISSVLEFDWEGSLAISTNNNTGAIRSPEPRLRLAYLRLDTHLGKTPVFLKVGQDWSLFTSSTMPTGIESTGVYVFQGVTWERLPGIVAGFHRELGGNWKWRIQPEAGIMLAIGGEGIFENPFSSLPGSGLGSVFSGNVSAPGQAGLGPGQREGVNSDRPHTEGRVVVQFQPFAHHPNVAPSQFIASFEASDRARIFAPPYTVAKPQEMQNFILKNQSAGYTAEFRFATPWSTLLGKYYHGTDLRQFFGGLAQDVFYDGPSPFGSSADLPRMTGVRSQGGFVEWQLPISALFHVERPALQGFSANFYYGQDSAFARDARRTGGRKAQHGVMADFIYQYNRFVQFGLEMNWTELLYTSRQGGPSRGGLVGTDLRKEFTTTFMF